MPVPGQSDRGWTVERTPDGIRIAFAIGHEVGARVMEMTDEEARRLMEEARHD